MEKAVRLIDAPVGLLMYKNRLLMKTEYGCYYDGVYSPDCYIVESGEVFIGGSDNAEYRNNLRVTPIDPESLLPHGKWEWFEEWNPSTTEHPRECEECGWRCGKCKTALTDMVGGYWDSPDEEPKLHYCPNCGVKMER